MSVLLLSALYPGEGLWRELSVLESGIKSCMNCGFPHYRKNYDKITGRFREIAAVMSAANKEADKDET